MSCNIDDFGGYGSGSLGDVTDPDKTIINAYAAVEDINTYNFLANPFRNSDFVAWKAADCVGCQVMLHCIAAKSGATGYSLCGRYLVATITDAAFEDEYRMRVTIDKSTAAFAAGKDYYFWQAVLIPEFKNLTLQAQSVKPYEASLEDISLDGEEPVIAPVGGVLAFKCSDTLTLAGGHIDLRSRGFDTSVNTAYRPISNHESNGTLDTDLYSGCENSITKDKLLVNCGDGACFIIAKNIVSSSGSSRIGNPATSGVQYCRGAADSANTPANVSNIGGSCDSWNNFTPAQIAKYRSGEGRGLARAYLAVGAPGNSFIPDEGLYALDCLQNKKRPKERFNLSGFGNGSDGTYTLNSYTPQKCWNSYAKVTAVSGKVYTISRVRADVDEFTDFQVGRLVMIHQSRKSSAADWDDGNFKFSRIAAISGSTVTVKHNFDFNLSTYNVQMIVVPEFQNLTLSKEYNNTPVYHGGAGGIFAICVKGTCNLSGGTVNMEGRGTFNKVVNVLQSNYWMKRSLPLGQGNGSVLIIANNLVMNSSTRLGGTYDGSQFGGRGGAGASDNGNIRNPGWGGGAGQSYSDDYPEAGGGWHSNAPLVPEDAQDGESATGCQGAHVLIIADSIDGLNLSALSTGGGSGLMTAANGGHGQLPGGCGYGGGGKIISDAHGTAGAGGYRGGGCGSDFKTKFNAGTVTHCGGGGAGAAFVYCNSITNQTTTGLVLS